VLHETVLKEEAVAALAVQPNGFYIDATFGRGGHTEAILNELGPDGRLLVLDQDPEAIAAAHALAEREPRLLVKHERFSSVGDVVNQIGVQGEVAGILFDLGVSSPQLDNPDRGFSFMHDGPLDMRMNTADQRKAADWINSASERDIADVSSAMVKRDSQRGWLPRLSAKEILSGSRAQGD